MNEILIKEYVKTKIELESSGHDFLHAQRVVRNATMLMDEKTDNDVIIASCYIHDLIDHKLEQQYKSTESELKSILQKSGLSDTQINHVLEIINNISFSSNGIPCSEEGRIVQDADRLDALGAIGIARTFSYGGKNNRLIYHPDSIDDTDSLSHFYQKLFLLEDKMNTIKGKEEAKKRTLFMHDFVNKLLSEIKQKNN
jgi:uncharacterized protein